MAHAIARSTATASSLIRPVNTKSRSLARCARSCSGRASIALSRRFAPVHVLAVSAATVEPVFNLHVDEHHEFFADGVLVHNCIWALSELMIKPSFDYSTWI